MIITCPSCATRYQVPNAAFSPDDGRRVRCQSCGFKWFAVPEEDESESPVDVSTPDTPEEDGAVLTESGEELQAEDDVEPDYDQATLDFTAHLAEAARLERNLAAMGGRKVQRDRKPQIGRFMKRPMRSAPGKNANLQGWAAVLAFIALCMFVGFEYRDTIVRAVPRASNIYAAAGLPVNVLGVDFVNIRVAREFENGLPVLAVEGEVVNVTELSLIHISEPTRLRRISYAVFCLKKKKTKTQPN